MDAKELSIEASEKELLQLEIASNQEVSENENIKNRIGEELKDKKIGEYWKILVTENEVYGTNWSYVKKGTKFENNQELENDYVINYETGEIKKLNTVSRLSEITNFENIESLPKNIILSSDDAKGTDEGLILDIDMTALDGRDLWTEKEFKNIIGEGYELEGFNWNENSGPSGYSFKFDGVDDTIKIDFKEKTASLEEMKEKGFTLEYYGTLAKGILKGDLTHTTSWYAPLLHVVGSDHIGIRFGIQGSGFEWNCAYQKGYSDLSTGSYWNQSFQWNESNNPFRNGMRLFDCFT